jgi:hypothetical protein
MAEGTPQECVISEPRSSNNELNFHIMALFVVLGVSILGALIPVLGKQFKSLKFNDYHFLLAKVFGTGVILATGNSLEFVII